MKPLLIKIKFTSPHSRMPQRSLTSLSYYVCAATPEPIPLQPFEPVAVPTGLQFSIPDPFLFLVSLPPESSFSSFVIKLNPNFVDNTFQRNELSISMMNLSSVPYLIQPQECICQLTLIQVQPSSLVPVFEFGKGAGDSI